MKRLFIFIKPYWKFVLLAPALMALEVLMDLIQPSLIAKVIDSGVVKGDIGLIVRTGLLMIGVAIVGGCIGGFGCTVASSLASQSFGTDLRSDLFRKIQSFSFKNIDVFTTSSLITRLTSDITQVQNLLLMGLRVMVRSPLMCIGGVIMAISLNAKLALILLFSMPIIAFLLAISIIKGFPLFTKVQRGLDKVNAVMRENLAGVRVVKAFARSDFEKSRFKEANEGLMEITTKGLKIMAVMGPLMMLMMNLSITAVIWFGGIEVNAGSMEVGEIVAFVNYMMRILMSLMMLAFILIMTSRAKASADRIIEVMDTETDIDDPIDGDDFPITEGRVVFENVTFSYERWGRDPVLKGISFEALPGDIIAIIGATGSGKSTLVNLIPRLYDVTGGRILVDGKDIRNITLKRLKSHIGMVLQEPILFSGTIRDNIRWGRIDARDDEVIDAAVAAQAHDFIMSFPEGYDTQLGQMGVNLSGGQKQRISIARALLMKPKILILDDSTSSVDMGTEARIQKALKEKMKDCTTFIVAQRISSVKDADRILVLDDGEIATEGRHEELLATSRIYREIYSSQLGEGEEQIG